MTHDGLLVVQTERFHGPLDLLLHLIRTQDIDIFDIPIARITRQFLEAIEGLVATDVDEAGEFLEMAAALVRIKARMLLPGPAGEEDHDPRAELVRRLLEYEMIREVAARLRVAENDRGRRFEKGYVQPRPRPRRADAPLEVTREDFLAAALRVEPPAARDIEHRIATRPIALQEKVGLIVEPGRSVGGADSRGHDSAGGTRAGTAPYRDAAPEGALHAALVLPRPKPRSGGDWPDAGLRCAGG